MDALVQLVHSDDFINEIADRVVEYQERERDCSALKALEARQKDNEKAIANMLAAIEAGIITPSTKSRLTELEAERANIDKGIARELIADPTLDRDQIVFFLERFRNQRRRSEKGAPSFLEVNTIFLLDIGADLVTKLFDCIEDLIYQKIIELLGEFFSYMNSMGSDLFDLPWVNQIVNLFSMLGWALFIVGIIVALFDFAIESQNGRGDPKALAMNIIKGFMSASLFTVVPVKLYGLAVAMQSSMSADMTGV